MDNAVTAVPEELAMVGRALVEPAAFAAIYDHYFSRVYNYVRYRVVDRGTADDLTAQVFERALANLSSYSPERTVFGVWLFSIARNAISDHLRARSRRRWLSLDVLVDRSSDEPQPEQIAVQNETYAELLAAVARLNNRERDVIALKFAAGFTNRRIASLLSMSESNVGIILYRAVRRLRIDLIEKE